MPLTESSLDQVLWSGTATDQLGTLVALETVPDPVILGESTWSCIVWGMTDNNKNNVEPIVASMKSAIFLGNALN